ncbi:hypothetical protein BCF55_0989 [Hydrogenivirga caldilitoris]|uniref:Uncharacterized protein n=1 Tax=Hydrogenivirga caldilitoris TaxID=246264 RepID=A0A497XPA9_9AQUI|nr:hypothetical protein [Hydrogenivirga caldilitoris]RLJ70708.1 hypothetical protein BCF55_0989 [Hydrogenivirga caldilitoris]
MERFLFEGLRRKGESVHSEDLLVLVKRARTLEFGAFGVDIFDRRGRYLDTFIPQDTCPFWYEELAEEFVRKYRDCYFSFSFVPVKDYEDLIQATAEEWEE